MKKEFLISATRSPELELAIQSLDGKPLSDSSWIALWDRSADALCSFLRPACDGSVGRVCFSLATGAIVRKRHREKQGREPGLGLSYLRARIHGQIIPRILF